jgi:hypothetical protein
MTRAWLGIAFAATMAAAGTARAEVVPVCFNYGCTNLATVRFGPAELGEVERMFADVATPQAERDAIARAMGSLYLHAALQTPTWRDRGGNIADEGEDGRMDCIDHSTNTTAYLRLIERRGWLRFHVVGERVMRGRLLSEHWAARVVERGSNEEWVVDTWFHDPGLPAEVFPLEAWIDGAEPEGFRDRQHAAP